MTLEEFLIECAKTDLPAPEVFWDEDQGDFQLDWNFAHGRSVSVSVPRNGNGGSAWAWLNGSEHGCGVMREDQLDAEFIKVVLKVSVKP